MGCRVLGCRVLGSRVLGSRALSEAFRARDRSRTVCGWAGDPGGRSAPVTGGQQLSGKADPSPGATPWCPLVPLGRPRAPKLGEPQGRPSAWCPDCVHTSRGVRWLSHLASAARAQSLGVVKPVPPPRADDGDGAAGESGRRVLPGLASLSCRRCINAGRAGRLPGFEAPSRGRAFRPHGGNASDVTLACLLCRPPVSQAACLLGLLLSGTVPSAVGPLRAGSVPARLGPGARGLESFVTADGGPNAGLCRHRRATGQASLGTPGLRCGPFFFVLVLLRGDSSLYSLYISSISSMICKYLPFSGFSSNFPVGVIYNTTMLSFGYLQFLLFFCCLCFLVSHPIIS